MKSVILNVRISKDLKNALENQSLENEVSISDTIREIVENHFENVYDDEDLFVNPNLLYNSNEFLFLVSWLFEKKDFAYDGNSEAQLLDIKKIILEAIKEKHFPNNLKCEFEKVLIDIIRYINTYHDEGNHFFFCKPHHSGSFDYSVLINYISNRAFENRI